VDTLGERVRARREAAGLSQAEVAAHIGVDLTAVSKIETGARQVKVDELAGIAQVLGISPLAILEPDSFLGRLPMSPRSGSNSVEVGPARQRMVQLAEFHQLLADANVVSSAPSIRPDITCSLTWKAEATKWAQWALGKLRINAPDTKIRTLETLGAHIEHQLGIDVLIESFPECELSGAAITSTEFPLIFVNSAKPVRRALYTLAHELCHVLALDGSGRCEDTTMSGTDDNERRANRFAAELLMPEQDIRQIVQQIEGSSNALGQMFLQFGVSMESLAYRLHSLKMLSDEGRDRLKSTSPKTLAVHVDDAALRAELEEIVLGPSHQYRPPGLLLQRCWDGFESGAMSIRPYAMLSGEDPDDLLAAAELSLDGSGLIGLHASASSSDIAESSNVER
jgi:Zn-dependent peptidase ImmA (M78 family)/transcriptional regulator with XRE-family HTH domain